MLLFLLTLILIIAFLVIENGRLHIQGKFGWNALTVGRTRFGKTSFTQKLAINNFFGG